jgi:hypothetical protein
MEETKRAVHKGPVQYRPRCIWGYPAAKPIYLSNQSKKNEMDGAWEKNKNVILVWKPEQKNHMEDLSLGLG